MNIFCCFSRYRKHKNIKEFNRSILNNIDSDELLQQLTSRMNVAKLIYDTDPTSSNYDYYINIANVRYRYIQDNLSKNYNYKNILNNTTNNRINDIYDCNY
jgi:hypothetical protein